MTTKEHRIQTDTSCCRKYDRWSFESNGKQRQRIIEFKTDLQT